MSQSLEGQIRTAISSIPEKFPDGAKNSVWTRTIFKTLGDLGSSLGFDICASSSDGEFDGGWLYDLAWYKNNNVGELESISLVLESEWQVDYRHIKYDFEKLLAAKAHHKVMVFQAAGGIKEQYFEKMISGIQSFQSDATSEVYILACFDESKWNFDIRTYTKPNKPRLEQPAISNSIS